MKVTFFLEEHSHSIFSFHRILPHLFNFCSTIVSKIMWKCRSIKIWIHFQKGFWPILCFLTSNLCQMLANWEKTKNTCLIRIVFETKCKASKSCTGQQKTIYYLMYRVPHSKTSESKWHWGVEGSIILINSTRLLILLPHKAIYIHSFHYGTPCS